MIIQSYSAEDFQACVRLFIQVFRQPPWKDRWNEADAACYLSDYIHTPGFRGIVAKEGDRVHGLIFGFRKRWWSGDEFYIHEMCVDSGLQRTGTGTEMLRHLENTLKDESVSRITLLTDRGIAAEDFYRANGFEEIERLIFMNKELGEGNIR
ncbi:GNAT family N-acetyltransferase [Paenibacillus glufosinatiresistens]|uniref:GNAT family N-acetyltransferase n=1 Tax=Paenibacillus glufosinatiresistens TaxID=3070657 RepID=UPI00286E7263|nr:GNAT family N-acetyltransferase [Paenibacillus sp. YX.27]